MRFGIGLVGGAALALGLGAAALAQNGGAPSMAEVIHARQSHYKQIGGAMKGIVDEFKKPTPSVPAIQADADRINTFAPQIVTWFPKGSGSEAGLKTSAKAEIWAKPDEFKRDADAFMAEARKFDAVAHTGDLARIRAELPALGNTCKTCHESFRVRED